MWTYTIKKDGYAMFQTKALNRAVRALRGHLDTCYKASKWHWLKVGGEIRCQVTTGTYIELYTIERTSSC